MKYLSYIYMPIVLALLMLANNSCTRNNGDIGPWFGTWRVDYILIDDDPDPDYGPPYMIWKFQSSVIQIQVPDFDSHTETTVTGIWHQDDDLLTINFDWGHGTPPAMSHLPVETKLNIIKLSHSTIELQFVDDNNITYFYKLQKWG